MNAGAMALERAVKRASALGLVHTEAWYERKDLPRLAGMKAAYGRGKLSPARANAIATGRAPAIDTRKVLPPIEVYVQGDDVRVSDGRHRLRAAQEAGATRIRARVSTEHRGGTFAREAILSIAGERKNPMNSQASFARYVHELTKSALDGKADPVAVLEHLRSVSAKALAKKNPAEPVFTREQIVKAIRDYRWKHWGSKGNGRASTLTCADPTHEPLREMGRLVSVTYETTKFGDPPGTHYEHDFSRPLPVLAYSSGGLVICGGGYKVEARGIVG